MPIDRNTAQYITGNPQQPTQSSAPGIWDIDEQGSAQAAGRWPLPPNVVQRSLRFNTPDSAYLNRTPAVAGNRKLWTYSCWMKRSASGVSYILVGEGSVNDEYTYLQFDSNDLIYGVIGVVGSNPHLMKTVAAFRDYSAWYHIVSVFDTDNAVGADRWQIWVNGVKQSLTVTNTMSQGFASGWINNNSRQLIGRRQNYSVETYSNYYLAEVNFIDGQALTPSSFGQTDAQTGQWIPRVYSGSYGTNGYRLQFLDNSGTTATTLGKDTSGMGNNWTPNNFSVTAGTGNDSLRDVPMNYYSPDNGLGGEVIGNYCTWNPLDRSSVGGTTADGNLSYTNSSAGSQAIVRATIAVTSGKWYWETTMQAFGGSNPDTGIVASSQNMNSADQFVGNLALGYSYAGNGQKRNNNTGTAYGSTYTTGDIIGVALDMDAGTLTFYKNGVSQGQAFSGLAVAYAPAVSCYNNGIWYGNFGQRPFAYTAPSGFKALCTQNLPWTGTITTSGTFTGNASTDGPFVYLNGIPTAMTINGNAVTFGTQADKLSNGFKVRSSSSSYNASGSNTYSVSTTGNQFSKANAQANP